MREIAGVTDATTTKTTPPRNTGASEWSAKGRSLPGGGWPGDRLCKKLPPTDSSTIHPFVIQSSYLNLRCDYRFGSLRPARAAGLPLLVENPFALRLGEPFGVHR